MNVATPLPDPRRAFRRGFILTLPMQLATIPFGLVFGALAIEVGFDVVQTVGMSMIVIGGASQLVALNLLVERAPVLVVLLAAALVNLRMAMYSAALAVRWQGVGPWPRLLSVWFLNDQSFAISLRRYTERPEMPPPERAGFFIGSGTCCLIFWSVATLVGAVIGTRLPPQLALEFMIPLVFIAVAAPFLRGMPNLAAAVTAAALSVALREVPHSLGLILAAFGGIAVGMALKVARPALKGERR
jgi:4-azaleucine resistance transporter AzlC